MTECWLWLSVEIWAVNARWTNSHIALISSSVLHAGLFWSAARLLPDSAPVREPESVKVRLAEPPPPAVVRTPAPVVTPKPTPRPPVRVDKRQPPPPEPVVEPEVRAGLSDSLALPGTAKANAPAIAVGNSSMATVNPEDANKPPPAPLSGTESVSEALADAPAKCPVPPNLELTTDALNAGLTNAEVVIEVAVAASGLVEDARLKSGTGYEIDSVALKAALKLRCTPALLSGRAVGVAGKKLVWKVMYD